MSATIKIVVGAALLFGSASATLAASHHKAVHRSIGYGAVRPAAPPSLSTDQDPAARAWGGCATDDGQGRFRPCSGI